jgi:hypothetical protein
VVKIGNLFKRKTACLWLINDSKHFLNEESYVKDRFCEYLYTAFCLLSEVCVDNDRIIIIGGSYSLRLIARRLSQGSKRNREIAT